MIKHQQNRYYNPYMTQITINKQQTRNESQQVLQKSKNEKKGDVGRQENNQQKVVLKVHTENIKFNIMNKVQRQHQQQGNSKEMSQLRSRHHTVIVNKQASVCKERVQSTNKTKKIQSPQTMQVRISMCQIKRPAVVATNVISPISVRSSVGNRINEVNQRFQGQIKNLNEKSAHFTVEKSSQSLSDFLS